MTSSEEDGAVFNCPVCGPTESMDWMDTDHGRVPYCIDCHTRGTSGIVLQQSIVQHLLTHKFICRSDKRRSDFLWVRYAPLGATTRNPLEDIYYFLQPVATMAIMATGVEVANVSDDIDVRTFSFSDPDILQQLISTLQEFRIRSRQTAPDHPDLVVKSNR